MLSILTRLINLILKGEIIILPTDTVYGLVCRYDSKSAVEKIYQLKKRSRKKPLILLGYNWNSLKKFVNVTKSQKSKVDSFSSLWPGPVTLVLRASSIVPNYLNKGFKTIGVRVPKNKFLLQVLKHTPGRVLASTSANISGKDNHNGQKELFKKVKLFIKAKKNEMSGKPSRIIEITKTGYKVLR